MTELVVENETPPDAVMDDAESIEDGANVEQILIENAVDMQWFIRIEGPVGDAPSHDIMSEPEFDDLCSTIENHIIGDDHKEFKTFHGVGNSDSRYVIRIEY